MTDDEIVEAMFRHVREFIEKPHPAFGNLPICPFAKAGRLSGKIDTHVIDFRSDEVEPYLRAFAAQGRYEVVQFIHRGVDYSLAELRRLLVGLSSILVELELVAFSGHPAEDMTVAGVVTSADPFPSIQVIPLQLLKKRAATLPKRYYQNWSAEELARGLPNSETPSGSVRNIGL